MRARRNRRPSDDTKTLVMKTTRKLISLLALLLGSAGIVTVYTSCSGTPTRESTGEYVDDTTITTKVKAALIHDPVVKAGQVTVTTFKGVVQLSGFVDTPEAKQRAATIAGGVDGVKNVLNDITVK
jgi:hyperosmotically inducible protein